MANRVGIIFHENWERFSPLLYSHNSGYMDMEFYINDFLNKYKDKYPTHDNDEHKYNYEHIMYEFICNFGENLHNRIENINVENIKETHKYFNCFDEGCFIVNVDYKNFGEIDWS